MTYLMRVDVIYTLGLTVIMNVESRLTVGRVRVRAAGEARAHEIGGMPSVQAWRAVQSPEMCLPLNLLSAEFVFTAPNICSR